MYISPDKKHPSILPIEIDGERRMLFVGAGGNIPGVRLSKEKCYRLLAEYASSHFAVTSVTHKWSDMDYLPYDSFPLVGKVYPWSKRMYQGTGYMKWGLSNGTVAAMLLHDIIIGRQNKWIRYFNSERLRPLLNIPRAVFKHFVK
jgi:glycine/D-amino acid oxidase-like deaminating enzyme